MIINKKFKQNFFLFLFVILLFFMRLFFVHFTFCYLSTKQFYQNCTATKNRNGSKHLSENLRTKIFNDHRTFIHNSNLFFEYFVKHWFHRHSIKHCNLPPLTFWISAVIGIDLSYFSVDLCLFSFISISSWI